MGRRWAVLAIVLGASAFGTRIAAAQVSAPLQMSGYADTTSDTSGVAPGVAALMRRAAAYVAMAREAPLASPTVRASRRSGGAARDAAAAYETALANYNAGYDQSARRDAERAIALAQDALAATLSGSGDLVTQVSGGELALPLPFAPPRADISMAATATPLPLPRSYVEAAMLPFGVTPAGPGAPYMRDSLPFGVIPVPQRGP